MRFGYWMLIKGLFHYYLKLASGNKSQRVIAQFIEKVLIDENYDNKLSLFD